MTLHRYLGFKRRIVILFHVLCHIFPPPSVYGSLTCTLLPYPFRGVLYFFRLYWGSWGALLGAERLGTTAFPFGAGVPGQSERGIEWMKEVKPTVFYLSYVLQALLSQVFDRINCRDDIRRCNRSDRLACCRTVDEWLCPSFSL